MRTKVFLGFAVFVIGGVAFFAGVLVERRYHSPLVSEDFKALAPFGQIIATLLIAAIGWLVAVRIARIPGKVQQELHDARRESEKRQNAVRLSDTFNSLSYYKEVAAVVWEVFVKWRYWEGDGGDRYRLSVVTGFVHYLSHYQPFRSPSDFNQAGHNVIRFLRDHYHPADYSESSEPKAYIQTVLSEHQALTTWLEQWGNVNTMIDQELIDEQTVRQLFGDWYQYWLQLVVEVRRVVKRIHEIKNSGKMQSDMEKEPTPRWIAELEKLEERFYCKPDGHLLPWYRARTKEWTERAEAILRQLGRLEPTLVQP